MVKILTTLLIPTSGTARVLGHDVVNDVDRVRRRIGFVFGGNVDCTGAYPAWTTCITSPTCIESRRMYRAAAFLSCSSAWTSRDESTTA